MNLAVGGDNFNLKDVVQTRSPHTRHWSEAADRGMASGPDVGANAVGHSAATGIVHLLRHLAQACSSAHRGLPCGGVHREMLEIDHVDGNSSILATKTWLNISTKVRQKNNVKSKISSP